MGIQTRLRQAACSRTVHLCAMLPLLAGLGMVASVSGASAGASRHGSHAQSLAALVKMPVGSMIVDEARHRVFGAGFHQILALDESSDQVSTVLTLGRRHLMEYPNWGGYLALDARNGHLLVADLSFKSPDRNPRQWDNRPSETVARVVDPDRRTVINTLRVSGSQHIAAASIPAVTVVDSSVHHGFVVDVRGIGAMIDTGTGRLLARFHVGPPSEFMNGQSMAVVDTVTHRLFIGLGGPTCGDRHPCPTVADEVAIVNTATGGLVRTIRGSHWPTSGVALDAQRNRVFVTGRGVVILVLDASRGTILHQTVVRLRPKAPSWMQGMFRGAGIAVDKQTGRTFVGALRFVPSKGQSNGIPRIKLLTLDSDTGRVLRETGYPSLYSGQAWMAVDRKADRLFVLDDQSGALAVFSARTGRYLGAVPLGRNIVQSQGDVVVDEGTHRAFVSGRLGVTIIDSLHAPATKGSASQTSP